ncbi:LamG-like jellyroll fold domain-containing protein [Albibacterium profundi]|uniref:LamG-like jellyroll fold domain-containing protein n=1 Tax=Albibacterium profundi TaxID=3134906 RepID=A0ABV5CCE8_9SPHI
MKIFKMKRDNFRNYVSFMCLAMVTLGTVSSCTMYENPSPVFEEYETNTNSEIQRKVLVVSIDGVVGSEIEQAVPQTISKLIENGKYTWSGISEAKTNDASTWTSMVTGVSVDKHLVEDETFRALPDPNDPHSLPDFYPSLFYRLLEARPEYNTVAISPWSNLVNTLLIEAESRIIPENDVAVKDSAVFQLVNKDPEVMFVNFRSVLEAGVADGFSIENPSYLEAINVVDGYLAEIFEALENREAYEKEEWLVVVTSNHGGTGNSYGEGSLRERNTFSVYHHKNFESTELIPTFIEAPDFYQTGTNSYTAPVYEAANANDYDFDGTSMTVEFRLKRNAKYPWVGEPMIFGKTGRTSFQTKGKGWGVATQSNHLTFYAQLEDGTDIEFPFQGDIDDFQWHHFVLTFEVKENVFTLKLYNDGRLTKESSYDVENANAAKIQSTAPFFVGVRNSHNAGVLSRDDLNFGEIRIYDKALTADEVMESACLPFLDEESTNYNHLVGYWRLNTKVGDRFENTIESKSALVATSSLPLYSSMSSLVTPCNVDDDQNVIVGNVDLLSQIFYWLRIETKPDWALDGSVFLDQYEIEFVN